MTKAIVLLIIKLTLTIQIVTCLSSPHHDSSSSSKNNVPITPCNKICRYNANVFNGQVCIGCFRDTIEISTWSQMTNDERGYAILDAIERIVEVCQNQDRGCEFDGSVDVNDLRKQAQFWFDKAKKSSDQQGGRGGERGMDEKKKESQTFLSNNNNLAFVTDDSSAPLIEAIKNGWISMNSDEKKEKLSTQCSSNNLQASSFCLGNCQFNPNFWEGQVCTNCFRDTFEVQNWNTFTKNEKDFAFMDITERMKESINKSESFTNHFDWKEFDIETQEEKVNVASSGTFQEFREGDKVIQISSIVDPIICEMIVERVRVNACNHRLERQANGLADEGLVRLPTIDASKRAQKSNTASANPIDEETDAMLKEILKRLLKCLDLQLSSLVETIFGTGSLYQVHADDNLIYSSREPAINIYTKGGRFLAHEDGQQLTVLIPLSSPNEFDGGGTAFWSHQSRGHRVDPPSLVLKPSRGSVLIFGGDVTHAGLSVEWGERVVFVASFSKRRYNK